jgi:hypothetical protein
VSGNAVVSVTVAFFGFPVKEPAETVLDFIANCENAKDDVVEYEALIALLAVTENEADVAKFPATYIDPVV